eukprot:jgi/Hompol1/7072/HPOL_005178-RA
MSRAVSRLASVAFHSLKQLIIPVFISKRNSIFTSPLAHPSSTKLTLFYLNDNIADIRTMLQQLPSEESVQQLYNSLADAKDLAAIDLQRNVFRNYNDFVMISKEISKLESDMLYLRGLLTELKDVEENLRPDVDEASYEMGGSLAGDSIGLADDPLATPAQKMAAAADAAAKLRAKEDEVTEMREAQMKVIYATIDGLQKLLPESKGRYLLREGSKTRFYEVNPASFKQKDMVHLYLFNDSLVVASWKKSIMTGKARMVAEAAWNLSEIGFIDMKDSPDVTNAFKIVKHPEVSIYRSEVLEDKRAILAAIKRITDDILAQKRREKELAKDPTLAANKVKATAASIQSVASLTDPLKQPKDSAPVKDNLSVTDYRWLIELPDELDVLVAHRDLDNAVVNLEKARRILSNVDNETSRIQTLRASVEQRTENLAKLISMDLASPVSTKPQVQENIDRLLRLGLGDQARDIFLTARTNTIRHRTRQLKFDGDIVAYMSDLAEVTFRLIRNTCDWYGGSFRDSTMASGFMKWVTNEITHFTATLRRQVFDSHQRFSIISECLASTLEHCQQLCDVGLDLTFLLDKIVFEDIAKAIDRHSKTLEDTVAGAVRADKFELLEPRTAFFADRELTFETHIPMMAESAYTLSKSLTDFASDVGALMSMPLYNKIVSSLSLLFNVYVREMSAAMEQDLATSQYCSILSSMTFIVDFLLPKVESQLQAHFERPIPELKELCAIHKSEAYALVALNAKFVTQCISRITRTCYTFSKVDYTNLVLCINKLLSDMDKILDRHTLECGVIEGFFENMLNTAIYWETERGPRKFGFGGVQTLILDIHFTLRAAEHYVTETANEHANAVCEKALRAYFVQNKDLAAPLKTGEWYDKRVDEAMRKYGRNFMALGAEPA